MYRARVNMAEQVSLWWNEASFGYMPKCCMPGFWGTTILFAKDAAFFFPVCAIGLSILNQVSLVCGIISWSSSSSFIVYLFLYQNNVAYYYGYSSVLQFEIGHSNSSSTSISLLCFSYILGCLLLYVRVSFHMKMKIILSWFVKNCLGILMEIAWNL